MSAQFVSDAPSQMREVIRKARAMKNVERWTIIFAMGHLVRFPLMMIRAPWAVATTALYDYAPLLCC